MSAYEIVVGLVVLAGLPAFAGDTRDETDPAKKLVSEFRKKAKVEFKECSDVKCVDVALGSCAPVHLFESFGTIEGTPAKFDYFVVKEGEECRVVEFSDFSRDYWGACKVLKRRCPNMKAAKSDDPDGLGCSPPKVIYKAGVCKNPMKAP